MSDKTLRLTTAQAIIRYLAAQYIKIDGAEWRLCGGGFGIFGHGNVTCLGEALYDHREELPLYRGQNEQSMGFAAAAYSKYWLRQRFMFCTASAGPGTANLLTSAALAHANRLPMLMLCGDTFLTRLPDPVLQQLEHFGNPTFGVNDAFKAVSRYWDRITHPAQVIQLETAKRPVIIAGGGVQYSGAVEALQTLAKTHGIPVIETIAGRANLTNDDPLNIGPVGVTGSDSANWAAERADVILAVGTRLQDFTTGSWTAFAKDAKIIGLNVGRHDAMKHMSLPVVGDALEGLGLIHSALDAHKAPADWLAQCQTERGKWNAYVAENVKPGNRPNSYAQAIGVANALMDKRDRVVAAAGGLPAEVTANWRTLDVGTVDVEFGFSCMGYEIAGAWGARIAQAEREPERDVITFCGDGSYLMLNSDLYSSVLTQKKIIALVLDNGGFAVINKLQNNTGNESFNNLIADTPTVPEPFGVDFEAHAASMGCNAETVENPAELAEAFKRAQAADKTTVIVMKVDPYEGWTTEGHTWWEVGTPHVTDNPKVKAAHEDWESTRPKQRKGV